MRMKMDNAFYVEPIGIAGGLALWWNNEVKLSVLLHDKNFIDTVISINGESEWFGTFIYAPPYEEEKQEFWERLGTLRDNANVKWCIMGIPISLLMKIQSKGGTHTWSNERSEEDEICEKLDKVISSVEWNFLFPKAIAIIDVSIASDHTPIILLTNGVTKSGKKEFKFESRWSLEEECSNIIQEEWTPPEERHQRGTFRVKLRRTKV
ncbi:hypothetical protein V6N11_024541 [Hibiscus sabdariffa]|uniref:Endonuclease/exonuclease/phosphatase domain-containing protein n=1 Tax=Hibiscus sabdariffa TaxID=183260 RepID=A0ABR2QMF1_9ROSI